MFDHVKDWLNRTFTETERHHALESLPPPKAPEGQALSECRLVVLDCEMTGLNPSKDQVIAVGAVAISNFEIPLRDQFDLVLRRPEADISKTVLIHGIGPEALSKGHETEEALLYLLNWINGDPILAFHSDLDQSFLEKTLRQTLGYTESHLWLDVAELLPAMFPNAQPRAGRLDNWVDHFALELTERHHAAADALATAELTLMALNRATKTGITSLDQICEKLRHYRRLKRLHRQ
ncbi:MAG: 3'-5' exonuclease [Oleiphilaceae bacterium]|nr:3'-5' exonuclease [Oleiphilaceae bacterium]